MDQPRQPVLHHHPALPVLAKGLTLLQGPGLLQQRFLRVQLHRSSRTRFCRHAPGPQRAYSADRSIEPEALQSMSSTGGTGPSPGRPYYPGSLPRRTGAGASFKVNPKVLLHVAGEPAVAGPEGLGFGRLSVPHDPEPVLVGVDALLEFNSSQGWSTPRESGSFCLNPVAAETVERVRAARFSAANSLDTFDFPGIPSVNKALVMELARCEYIQRRENVIAVGNSGAGKAHIALGLGLAAC